jgi:hypothetical protein
VSVGDLTEQNWQKKEAPYSVFVDPKSRYIALMLYENNIKIIPLGRENDEVVLRNSFNLRIRHPEAHQILPFFQDE